MGRLWQFLPENSRSLLVRRADIEQGIDQCQQELDSAIQAFTVRLTPSRALTIYNLITATASFSALVSTKHRYYALKFLRRNQIAFQRAQMDARAMELQNHAESRDLLLQILANQEELKRVVALHQAGEPVAEEIMQEGQEVPVMFLQDYTIRTLTV